MAVLVLSRERTPDRGLRPLDIMSDLEGIGKLVDLAFADDIAQDGSQLRRDLMMLSATSPLIWAICRVSTEMRDAFDGFVWIEEGRVVGNATLTREDAHKDVWTIANVAVHPDFRRRGIARALMQACLQAVTERGCGPVVLQVKPDNRAAYDLYLSLGFRFVDGAVTARCAGSFASPLPLAAGARRVPPEEWRSIYAILAAARSPLAARIAPLTEKDFRPSLLRRLSDGLSDAWTGEQRFWLAIEEGGRFLAAARVVLRPYSGSNAEVTIHPDGRNRAEEAVLQSIFAACGVSGTLTVQAASEDERSQAILRQHGFKQVRHLHRMLYDIEEKDHGRDTRAEV